MLHIGCGHLRVIVVAIRRPDLTRRAQLFLRLVEHLLDLLRLRHLVLRRLRRRSIRLLREEIVVEGDTSSIVELVPVCPEHPLELGRVKGPGCRFSQMSK